MWILLASLIVQGAAEVKDPAPLEPMGRFDARAIPEASGIVKSRRHPGIFWVHNDSGNAPLLFAVRADGRIVRRFRLAFPNLDWEGIAIDDQGHLYLGDIGNNSGLLRVRTIYRIDEPDPATPDGGDRDIPLPATRTVTYALPPSNRFDAEGLVYDRGTAIVVAKYLDGREAELFAVTMDTPAGPAPTPIRPIGRLPGFTEPATGADLSEDGTLLAVCSYAVRGSTDGTSQVPGSGSPSCGTPHSRSRVSPGTGTTWSWRPRRHGLFRLREAAWRAAAPGGGRSRPKAQ